MTEQNKKPSGRPVRKPVGARNRLEIINKEPGREYRLIDSDPARVNQFLQAGYRVEEVKNFLPGAERLGQGSLVDNALPVGGGSKQLLVSIEKEFYEQDQKEKIQRVKQTEEAIKPNTSDGFYGKVSIEHS
jgi:hypothetical protein